ncbi:MAG: bifunctional 2-polyprenyl-6-hydroxyphenol methylase/3-demethylubiquinol 3-O-methyltransferase UbiG [Alphaproteobacteria bacterium]|nr:bifunctional 2-polyprenyl-6-hydroxyphenol methylase/3-demethylubiquinol 3-O-methyltransferase UbiG [Alphaproteobacteria bacterium]
MSSNVSKKEIAHFSKDSHRWWEEDGPFAPLHRLNPTRLSYLKAQICARFCRNTDSLRPFEGLRVLDIGCGGGLVCEPLTRLGASVTGIDADAQALNTAQDHAISSGLDISYKQKLAEELRDRYDVVLALEIAEHVPDLTAFVESCARLLEPSGLAIFSTLNRTPKSFALGIIAAEYVLRWVPQGTHHWKNFVRPSELARAARHAGLRPEDVTGLIFNPLKRDFTLSRRDLDVNYFMSAVKADFYG